jgi:hypothetical protein
LWTLSPSSSSSSLSSSSSHYLLSPTRTCLHITRAGREESISPAFIKLNIPLLSSLIFFTHNNILLPLKKESKGKMKEKKVNMYFLCGSVVSDRWWMGVVGGQWTDTFISPYSLSFLSLDKQVEMP